MSTVAMEPLIHHYRGKTPRLAPNFTTAKQSSLNYTRRLLSRGATFCSFKSPVPLAVRASSTGTAPAETSESADVVFDKTFSLKCTAKVEGKILIRLNSGKDEENWQLTVGCSLPGKWVLHWGVNYVNDIGRSTHFSASLYMSSDSDHQMTHYELHLSVKFHSEWDQPPLEMRPPDSIAIKDYAIETPLKKSSTALASDIFYEVKIDFNLNSSIAAINFVLKDEDTGTWYQHKGRDFKVPLTDYVQDDGNVVGSKRGFGIWPGALGQLSNMLLNSEGVQYNGEDGTSDVREPTQQKRHLEGFYEEHSIVKESLIDSSVSVSVRRSPETAKNSLHIETDLPGDIVVHWGICKDEGKRWEIPAEPYPTETVVFKNKAMRTLLQRKEGGHRAWGFFTLDDEYAGFLFVLKLDENTWLNYNGNDFYIPLSSPSGLYPRSRQVESEKNEQQDVLERVESGSLSIPENTTEANQAGSAYTDEIISEIRNLVSGISSEKSRKTKSKEAQETILQKIEKLAAEAYSIFRTAIPTFWETAVSEAEAEVPTVKICSGTGSGFEIVCQGFNWESHRSGKWYMELHKKAAELSSRGFTVVWLPPPTESISPEGYMPKDLYNLNSRYGSIDELKVLVTRFHEVGIKVLGDAVLNHRCAHYKNQNGIWNIFGGRLNWDDRAVVADDPHFQGRGNKSSGDNFHAAPNIDHSQDFVRKDIREWLFWLRNEIGYDGWRLDFVRGFWGGYVKEYMDASEPYFAVGEYWDSLSYTYGEMDHNQDAHRQRIIDWINATNGTAGAFDVTTKGILHSALERCEYWRLSDQKGKPPGVVGWWPSRAVTFIENHDTGSTQGHWRFPVGKEMQGYAYILTHPGTPSVFYDHIQITKAERNVYAAMIDEKVAMKIGPGHYEPPSGPQKWSLAIEGNNYKVWEAS
ncbi:hypothetical protein RJ639_040662 [Escallonia herrerae]|uniref:alpha-amylase n=1 Tax=Escallonia herrerae TaxID=1293975 RepID=A0AA88WJ46_9ASTE|nr:hypothetical protein RJ639_040662 [Escallonia herrerae]